MNTPLVAHPSFDCAQDLYSSVLADTLAQQCWVPATIDVNSVGSRFGTHPRRTKELICATLSLSNPRARIIDLPSRRLNRPFAFGNFLWTLSGSQDVRPITYYNSAGQRFSEDGVRFACALGSRMQRSATGSQLDAVVRVLRSDPTSRRAVIQFYSDSDSALTPRDTPCVLSIHFLLRNGRLIAVTHMRSQSALIVLPYDIILFTMLQEIVACGLDVPVGNYFHLCDSLHLYEDEVSLAGEVLRESTLVKSLPTMDPMPRNSFSALKRLCDTEAALRTADSKGKVDILRSIEERYWHDIMTVLASVQPVNHDGHAPVA